MNTHGRTGRGTSIFVSRHFCTLLSKNMNLCFILSKTIQTMRDGWKQDLRNLVTNDNPIPIFPPNHLKDTVIIM